VTSHNQAKTARPLTSEEPDHPEAPFVSATPVEASRGDEPSLATRSQGIAPAPASAAPSIARFLRSFQVLLRSARLYQKNHPRILESLETTERNLRSALALVSSVAVGVERGRLVVPMSVEEESEHSLPDPHGKLHNLADELSKCGITSLVFLPQTNLGELDLLASLLNAALSPGTIPSRNRGSVAGTHEQGALRVAPKARSQSWPERLAEQRISGILVNVQLERKVDPVLASLFAALLAYGAPEQQPAGDPATAPSGSQAAALNVGAATTDELIQALRLLAKLTPSLEQAQRSSPQQAAQVFHAALAESEHRIVSLLVTTLVREVPRQGEKPGPYVARLAEALVLDFVQEQFCAGRVAPIELRALFEHIGKELAAGAVPGAGLEGPTALASTGRPARVADWTDEGFPEVLHERFWAELPVREKSRVLRGADAWCMPVASLRRYLEELADANPDAPPGASPREARLVLLNYARCLQSGEAQARHIVAAGLVELHDSLEQLWPHQLPEELSRGLLQALAQETSPGIAGLLAAVTENVARSSVLKADYATFERILEALEQAPRDTEHAHLTALCECLVAGERWLLLVDAALANRALDPVLPRLLRRDPERLLDRLGLILTSPQGLDALPAMARLLRAVGEPALGVLQRWLLEPRHQRATSAVKLLAATQPSRLLDSLPQALPSWDWSLQDLAVAELARLGMQGTGSAFLCTVTEAHPLVVPMMLDQIGLAQETSAVPLLLEIAAGQIARLQDIFIRIKAIEALGRMRAKEAASLLGDFVGLRNGLTYAEPAGLRAVAEEALALIEDLPSSAHLRADYEALEKASLAFARPRRYLRVPLSAPFTAQIEGPQAAPARIHTLSLGGAFLESDRRLSVGEPIRVEIRAGLRRIHSTAVVRNVEPSGSGIEFVHMEQEDREKLRRLIRRLHRK
jgi:hypothetical protein